jgi:SAM-dependent methyltransferase
VGVFDFVHQRRLARLAASVTELYLIRSGFELGLFELLAHPLREEVLVERSRLDPELLRAWLRAANAHGLVRRAAHPSDAWHCAGLPAWMRDSAGATALRAVVEQTLETQQPVWRRLPELLRGGAKPAFGDRAAVERAAEVSRLTEEAALRALLRIPAAQKAQRVLDVGCGRGRLLAAYLARRRDAQGVGIELDAGLAASAREALVRARVERRGEILHGDFMSAEVPGAFDLIALHHNLYYFSPERWPFVFARVMARLAPGGIAAIGVPVRDDGWLARASGFARTLADFDLFLRCHANLHGLPEPETLRRALREAGFRSVEEVPILPGGLERFFVARAPD